MSAVGIRTVRALLAVAPWRHRTKRTRQDMDIHAFTYVPCTSPEAQHPVRGRMAARRSNPVFWVNFAVLTSTRWLVAVTAEAPRGRRRHNIERRMVSARAGECAGEGTIYSALPKDERCRSVTEEPRQSG